MLKVANKYIFLSLLIRQPKKLNLCDLCNLSTMVCLSCPAFANHCDHYCSSCFQQDELKSCIWCEDAERQASIEKALKESLLDDSKQVSEPSPQEVITYNQCAFVTCGRLFGMNPNDIKAMVLDDKSLSQALRQEIEGNILVGDEIFGVVGKILGVEITLNIRISDDEMVYLGSRGIDSANPGSVYSVMFEPWGLTMTEYMDRPFAALMSHGHWEPSVKLYRKVNPPAQWDDAVKFFRMVC